jgi:hypothetical protein
MTFEIGQEVFNLKRGQAGMVLSVLRDAVYEVKCGPNVDTIKSANLRAMTDSLRPSTPPPKTRACITSDRLTWDAEGELARTFGFWAANAQFYIDVPPQYQKIFEDKYFSLFGKVPDPQAGLYNISLDVQKWAIEAEITFPIGYNLPDDIAVQQTARDGKIARIQLFWALMEHGFELSTQQTPERIRTFVPENQRQYFDAGLKGE